MMHQTSKKSLNFREQHRGQKRKVVVEIYRVLIDTLKSSSDFPQKYVILILRRIQFFGGLKTCDVKTFF